MISKNYTVLITRFNWPHETWNNRSVQDYMSWLNVRFNLFKKITVSSIQNCHVKPDFWCILCDDKSINVTQELTCILDKIDIQYILMPYKGLSISVMVNNTLSNFSTNIIKTVRLDADDAVSSDFFQRINSIDINALEKTPTVISIPGGSVFDLKEKQFYYKSYHNNPFLTLVEFTDSGVSNKNILTVYNKMHTDMCNHFKTIYINSDKPLWTSVVHDTNLSNKVPSNSILIQDNNTMFKRFGFKF